ncbi:MAG: hypothetical protein KTR25_19385 [Myxococcales bacterium]|nr:hypothetical protein [Myxococcales bacterium]
MGIFRFLLALVVAYYAFQGVLTFYDKLVIDQSLKSAPTPSITSRSLEPSNLESASSSSLPSVKNRATFQKRPRKDHRDRRNQGPRNDPPPQHTTNWPFDGMNSPLQFPSRLLVGGGITVFVALLISYLRSRKPNIGALGVVVLSLVGGAYETHALWESMANAVPFTQDSFPIAVALGLTTLACSEGISSLRRPRLLKD